MYLLCVSVFQRDRTDSFEDVTNKTTYIMRHVKCDNFVRGFLSCNWQIHILSIDLNIKADVCFMF